MAINLNAKLILSGQYARVPRRMVILIKLLPWLQIVLSVVLVCLVLLQQSEAGLGAWSGGMSGANNFRSKRGAEKFIFLTTILISTLFILSAVAALFV
ncbi:MAG: preprotein translocase subunit SecG [Candidatus Vogelbacteria bacterium]|nr:preprotein translocase subunit SecG [Candidatus Vogelbacteria bacterium]